MTTYAEEQSANIQPPRRGEGIAVGVDTTARPYSLTGAGIAWNDQEFQAVLAGYVFLDLQNDGDNTIYYYFSRTNDADMNEATIQVAGTVLVQSNAVPKAIPSGQKTPDRIKLDRDLFLVVKTATGASTLRIFPSSDITPRLG